ncbi:MAG TPA: bifunctional diaminohydroxyphosphoribosylaminopyrimidine deaminase/5-amino-6-(5-phosphoribosylamino)uracil reductase RibD [Tepidisphaeraceae bacterium]|nr:bifunctional diaminohydroxyphosphoribosylaminopyrimidine deaminase/5-amino-6-(5-phosphoribosylamino)uracil reductase RibD [Tepidisphaeraceae bacterium]
MIDAYDRRLLAQARQLAARGLGRAEPNPLVGCVITKDNSIIGEGFHEQFGGAHAEPNALKSAARNLPSRATMYVTLEPCCHHGKLTPPCVPRLIDAGIGRVVIGTLDPNPEVNGRGVQQLRDAGIRVDLLDETESKSFQQLIAPYIAREIHDRPYVTMKWAETADGFVAGANREPLVISNASSRRFLHQLRARCDAILIGIGTALSDDPRLDARGVDVLRESVSVVLDRAARLRPDAKLFHDGNRDVLIFTTQPVDASRRFSDRATIHQLNNDSDFLEGVLRELGRRSPVLSHVLIEAGPTIAKAFFDSNLCDRLLINRSPTVLGNPNALRAASVPDHFKPTISVDFDGDAYVEYLNTKSNVFFDIVPSPDFSEAP